MLDVYVIKPLYINIVFRSQELFFYPVFFDNIQNCSHGNIKNFWYFIYWPESEFRFHKEYLNFKYSFFYDR